MKPSTRESEVRNGITEEINRASADDIHRTPPGEGGCSGRRGRSGDAVCNGVRVYTRRVRVERYQGRAGGARRSGCHPPGSQAHWALTTRAIVTSARGSQG